MPDRNGRFLGISTQGISNPYLDEVERRKSHERQERECSERRLTAMATGRAVYTPETFAP